MEGGGSTAASLFALCHLAAAPLPRSLARPGEGQATASLEKQPLKVARIRHYVFLIGPAGLCIG